MSYKIERKGKIKMSKGEMLFLVISVAVFLFVKDTKQRNMGIGLILLVSFIGMFTHIFTFMLVFYVVMFVVGLYLIAKEKRIDKANKGIDTTYESSLGLRIVSLLLPIVGLIVYAVNIVQNPKIAKECGKFALIGFCIGLALGSIPFIMMVA